MKTKICIISIIFLICTNVFAAKNENELAVHLLSYLAQDYSGAVQNGKVVSSEEYQEQMDFVTEVVRISKTNNYDDALKADVSNLFTSIVNKDNEDKVSQIAMKLKSNILKNFNLLTYPVAQINLTKAENLFKNNCMSCHGTQGYGDGEAGEGLDPAPTNFHDLERMHNISPYAAFNTISLGVNGTGMAPHDYLSEEDRWSLAYYVTYFRFKGISKKTILRLGVKESSSLSDNEIRKNYNLDDDNFMGVLASVRDINSNPPSGGNKGQLDLHLTKAINDLKNSFSSYKEGKISEAKNLSFTAYLMGVEPVEGMLKSLNEKAVLNLERDFSIYRSLITKKVSEKELETVLSTIISQLEDFRLSNKIERTNSSSLLMAFGIVLREAFEAGLILFLLFGLTKKSKVTTFNKQIHAGWISSVIIGIVLFAVIESYFTITGKIAESIAGYTAIIASAMLFYVGYWLHKNTDVKKLKDSLIGAVEGSVRSGKGLALFFIAFTACFREMFEIILFLKIIILDGHQSFYVAIGAVLAIFLTMIIIATAVKYSIRLNLKYVFKASTFLILALSTIFLGRGIGALQKTGLLEQTRIDIFPIPSIGFNSTLEVLIAQLSVLLAIFILTFASYRKQQLVRVSN